MRTRESQFSDSQAENLSWVNDPVLLGRASGIQTENGVGWHNRHEIGCQNCEFSLLSPRVGYVTQVGFDEKDNTSTCLVTGHASDARLNEYMRAIDLQRQRLESRLGPLA